MSQGARFEKLEEIIFVDPPRQLLPAKPPIPPLRLYKANFFVWNALILKFLPKIISSHLVMHIKATKTLWFALITS